MAVENINSIFRGIAKYTVFVVTSVVTFSCNFDNKNKSMEISDIIDGKSDLDDFIGSNFEKVQYEPLESPIHPFKVEFINKNDNLKFCAEHIEQCWIKKIDTLFAFFIIIKTGADISKNITERYGACDVSGSITTLGAPVGSGVFIWRKKRINIDLTSYFNILRIPKFEHCDLIIFGNMTRRQLTDRKLD